MRIVLTTFVLLVTLGLSAWWTTAADQPPVPRAEAPRTEAPAFTPLKPFTAFSWHFPGHGLPYVKPMVWINAGTNPRLTARAMRQLEAGTRVALNVQTMQGLLSDPRDICVTPQGLPTTQQSVWPEYGTEVVRSRWEEQIKEFAAGDGQIDHLVIDYEDNYSCWNMNEHRLKVLGEDPRWPALAREVGFADPTLALFSRQQNGSYLRWNAVQTLIAASALDRSMFIPLRRHFPKAGMTCYEYVNRDPRNAMFDLNGHRQYTFGEVPGTHQSPALYAWVNLFPGAPADFTVPFHVLIYSANNVRNCVRSSNRPVLPWVGFRSWPRIAVGFAGSDWWQEHTYHVALSAGSDNLLFFNPGRDRLGPADQVFARSSDNEAMNQVMADLQKQANDKRFARAAMTADTPWDAKVLVSAAVLEDGSTLARVTFREGVTEAETTIAGIPLKVQRPAKQLGAWVHVPKLK